MNTISPRREGRFSRPSLTWALVCALMISFSFSLRAQNWYLPIDNSNAGEPAVNAATAPAGYFLASDQACVQTIVDADPYCVNTDWDNICQGAYNSCAYGTGTDWYLPNSINGGPAVWASTAPADYYLADQACAQLVINNDPFCINTSWDSLCQSAYCACASTPGCTDPTACNFNALACIDDGSCIYPLWYIPNDVVAPNTPMVMVCAGDEPANYILADQVCAQERADNDPFCVSTDWDSLCQNNYNDCLYGAGCEWYLPNTVGAGPAVWACTAPADYYLANQPCAQTVINNDPYCVDTSWDSLCQSAYCACQSGCIDPTACNYDPDACSDDGSCTYPGCTYPNACNYNSLAGCEDGSCLFVDECGNCGGTDTAGCTDPGADNYDPAASCDDGSCFIGGCTYMNADNYNSSATVDDGSCTFPPINSCPEDLNNDSVVNAADLLQFLGAFGTVCP